MTSYLLDALIDPESH